MAQRIVTDRGLVLEPSLLTEELASPSRRFAALGLDLRIINIPSLVLPTLVGIAAPAIREPAALKALSDLVSRRAATPEATTSCMRDLIPLMVKYEIPGTPQTKGFPPPSERRSSIFGATPIVVSPKTAFPERS